MGRKFAVNENKTRNRSIRRKPKGQQVETKVSIPKTLSKGSLRKLKKKNIVKKQMKIIVESKKLDKPLKSILKPAKTITPELKEPVIENDPNETTKRDILEDVEIYMNEMLPVEKAAIIEDEKREMVAKDAIDEMDEVKIHATRYQLPEIAFTENEENTLIIPENFDMEESRESCMEIVQVLGDFANRSDPDTKRSEYVDRLIYNLRHIYGYNEYLMTQFIHLFLLDIIEFLDATDHPRPTTLRTNTLKTKRKQLAEVLINRGVNLDPLGEWNSVGLVVYSSKVPLGATPEYLSGYYTIQGASSMAAVLALNPRPGERVLDVAAAPGGKTTFIGQLMKNEGEIYANDINEDRAKAVIGNCHRMGLMNVAIICHEGRKLSTMFPSTFDRVLLDSPCSGTGVISKDPSVKFSKTEKEIYRCAHLQKELIMSAIDCCSYKSSTGAIIVYSTCSIMVEECEEVIQYALKNRHVKLVETGLKDFGVAGFTKFRAKHFHPSMNLTKRFYPHQHNVDGFFVAKLRKLSNLHRDPISGKTKNPK
ncbi:hypothetical protein A3Q56_02568 [Intoshia linei]|uniref:SAM-dependent MTase RsmB/NOP-type domain-containing protein n=1 Tax=Intoshia linei TaxID=1819745 RepID=A0A177B7U7_9BILA|nr:hypothetical protein A3Q56_02568 [Intoshia linei]